MKFLTGLLLDGTLEGGNASSALQDVVNTAYTTFKGIINYIMPIALGVVLLAGLVYSIILGVNYSKAEEAEDRKKAKERLIGAVVGFGITLVLIAVIYGVLNANFIKNLFPQA